MVAERGRAVWINISFLNLLCLKSPVSEIPSFAVLGQQAELFPHFLCCVLWASVFCLFGELAAPSLWLYWQLRHAQAGGGREGGSSEACRSALLRHDILNQVSSNHSLVNLTYRMANWIKLGGEKTRWQVYHSARCVNTTAVCS